jgi:hypothetical protein
MVIVDVDADGVRQSDASATEVWAERERALWEWAWTTPQAVAWESEPWRWYAVAQWVRTSVICEGAEAKAADKTAMLRLADQIGMTPAGLRENGWRIASVGDEGAGESAPEKPRRKSSRDRMGLKVVNGGGE